MANTFISIYIHIVFSTKNRVRAIAPENEETIWRYMGGICRTHGAKALRIGGMEDHIHLLIGLPAVLSISELLRRLKGESSKWITATFQNQKAFAWQDGYGAFSIGKSQIPDTIAYIQTQRQHHTREPFEQEFRNFVKFHDLDVDEKYLLG